METSEMQQRFYDSVEAVLKHTRPWGIIPWVNSNLPACRALTQSAEHTREEKLQRFWRDLRTIFPENIGFQLITSFVEEDKYPLAFHSDIISDAAKRDDAEFFISLGEVLRKRKEGKLLTEKTLIGPRSYPQVVAQLWIEGCLWLMTDRTALNFLNKILDQTFELAAYRAAKKSRRLNKHPASPIIGVEWDTPASVNAVKSLDTQGNEVCKPRLKKDWSIVGGVLTQISG